MKLLRYAENQSDYREELIKSTSLQKVLDYLNVHLDFYRKESYPIEESFLKVKVMYDKDLTIVYEIVN